MSSEEIGMAFLLSRLEVAAKGDLELVQSPEINALEAIRFAARLRPVCA